MELEREAMTFALEAGDGADVEVRGAVVPVRPGRAGRRCPWTGRAPTSPASPAPATWRGRAARTARIIFASVPTPAPVPLEEGEEAPQLGPA